MKNVLFALPIAALMSGCTDQSAVPNKSDVRASDVASVSEDALEAYFRAIMIEHAAYIKNASIRCISIGAYENSSDAPASLINRFKGEAPPIAAASRCGFDTAAFDRETGKPAIIFVAEVLGCSSAQSCRISGGYLIGNLGAQSSTYFVELKGKDWQVRRDPDAPMVFS